MMRLPDSSGLQNEVVLQKGHSINYGAPMTTMIRLGGGVPVEAGQANEVRPEDIEEAIPRQDRGAPLREEPPLCAEGHGRP